MTHEPDYQWNQTLQFRLDLCRLALAVDQRENTEREQADSLSELVREGVPVRGSRLSGDCC